MLKPTILALAIAASPLAQAAKCRNQGKILYTQDQYCPAGYTDITSGSGGSVSTVGKSASVQQQEQQFLAGRAADSQHYEAQIARQQQQEYAAANNQRSLCQSIDGQLRSTEINMRQINAWQEMDRLKQNHKLLRDQQFQLGCHR
ncbi:hypothetical protein GCM10027081_13480 [Cupriavidus yeoncheonensis]